MDTHYDEIRAKAEVLAEDAFWGSQDEGSLTSGIISLVMDEVERKMMGVRLAVGASSAPARTYTAASDEPPADVVLLRDESQICPFLHRVADRWGWSGRKNRLEDPISYDDALPWFEAAALAYNNGVLTEVV
jgi:hypothetical protein